MKTTKLYLVVLLILISFTSRVALANSKGVLTFNKYSNATCEDYAGTWVGFISELNYAKAWPVILKLSNNKNKIFGKLTSTLKLDKTHHTITIDCSNGDLNNILWGTKNANSHSTQEGFLIEESVMVLKLHYKSMPEDIYYIALLNKKHEPVTVVFQ